MTSCLCCFLFTIGVSLDLSEHTKYKVPTQQRNKKKLYHPFQTFRLDEKPKAIGTMCQTTEKLKGTKKYLALILVSLIFNNLHSQSIAFIFDIFATYLSELWAKGTTKLQQTILCPRDYFKMLITHYPAIYGVAIFHFRT